MPVHAGAPRLLRTHVMLPQRNQHRTTTEGGGGFGGHLSHSHSCHTTATDLRQASCTFRVHGPCHPSTRLHRPHSQSMVIVELKVANARYRSHQNNSDAHDCKDTLSRRINQAGCITVGVLKSSKSIGHVILPLSIIAGSVWPRLRMFDSTPPVALRHPTSREKQFGHAACTPLPCLTRPARSNRCFRQPNLVQPHKITASCLTSHLCRWSHWQTCAEGAPAKGLPQGLWQNLVRSASDLCLEFVPSWLNGPLNFRIPK